MLLFSPFRERFTQTVLPFLFARFKGRALHDVLCYYWAPGGFLFRGDTVYCPSSRAVYYRTKDKKQEEVSFVHQTFSFGQSGLHYRFLQYFFFFVYYFIASPPPNDYADLSLGPPLNIDFSNPLCVSDYFRKDLAGILRTINGLRPVANVVRWWSLSARHSNLLSYIAQHGKDSAYVRGEKHSLLRDMAVLRSRDNFQFTLDDFFQMDHSTDLNLVIPSEVVYVLLNKMSKNELVTVLFPDLFQYIFIHGVHSPVVFQAFVYMLLFDIRFESFLELRGIQENKIRSRASLFSKSSVYELDVQDELACYLVGLCFQLFYFEVKFTRPSSSRRSKDKG